MTVKITKDCGDGKFIAENEKGQSFKIFTVDRAKIQKSHDDRVAQVAQAINKDDIERLFLTTLEYSTKPIDIDHWRKLAEDLTVFLKRLYTQIGNPNIFHHYIKNIDPDYYGKADTFRKECKSLHKICIEIKNKP